MQQKNKTQIELAARNLAKRVAPIYQFLDWHWANVERALGEEEIFDVLVELYEDIKESLESDPDSRIKSISTGGLEVAFSRDEEETQQYVLSFKIEESVELYE